MNETTELDPPTIVWDDQGACLRVIDQRWLPHRLVVERLRSVDQIVVAIREMWVRGAPLIGATAAYGVYFAWQNSGGCDDAAVAAAALKIKAARPTAINLAWAVDHVMRHAREASSKGDRAAAALRAAHDIVAAELERSQRIGEHGLTLLADIAARKDGEPVNVLTHCNAGRLATIDLGTATAPIYLAAGRGIPVHVWVDETRPRNQGAGLTAWELSRRGVAHTVIVDNAGGHLMQKGLVDLVIVGTDRTTRNGDVVNKIGTYLKALAAHDNGVPFYVALPSSSIDWTMATGGDVPIETRDGAEIGRVFGLDESGKPNSVQIMPPGSDVANYAFDVTPARYVTGLITERGICDAAEQSLNARFPVNDR
ncbi:MAG TPA: S-methyl-5-thioribose-1-phosphate isomerase [Rhodothermales bacterium]|nr:S-methyl-5-thioribose-1-phosphate isomerase [Rhodothermales bacterium]